MGLTFNLLTMAKVSKKSEPTKFTVTTDELKNRPNLIKVDVKVSYPYNLPIKKAFKLKNQQLWK